MNCKIGTSKRFPISFGAAGTVYYGATKFDAVVLAEMSIMKSQDVEEAAFNFLSAATNPFQAALLNMRIHLPQTYRELRKSEEPLQIAFAAFEGGMPKYTVASFTVREMGRRIVVMSHRQSCPGDCRTGGAADVLGFNDIARQRVNDATFFRGLEPLTFVRRLIQLEIDAHPDKVGPPISVLTIDRTGTTWNDRGPCQ